MDPNTYYALQSQQLDDRRASPSNAPMTTPSGHYIPSCPQCGGALVRHLSNSSYECENGGFCNGHRFTYDG
jgi:predicted RNA-binding Zn-ribbon protein involved in translation (DUF1610 family)